MDKHQSTYQLIILDYKLPKYNGPFTTNLIRDYLRQNSDPEMVQPFITCLSYQYDKNEFDTAMRVGIDLFWPKPIFRANLKEILIKAKLINAANNIK